jgi:hypothetical protein
LFWSQKAKKQKVVIANVSDQICEKAFDAHFSDMISTYNCVVFLDLLSQSKQSEN